MSSSWNQEAQTLWQLGKRSEAIEVVVKALNIHSTPKPKDLLMQFSYYLFLVGDYAATCQVLENALTFYPNDQEIKSNLAVSYSRNKNYPQTIFIGEQLVAQDPNNFTVWDALAKSYSKTQQKHKAIDAGNQALQIKDTLHSKPTPQWSLPECFTDLFTQNKKKVIAFSLWGTSERYINGAIRNLLLAPDLYPGWEIWIYHDDSVPDKLCKTFIQLGAILHKQSQQDCHEQQDSLKQKLCWRFQVANHPDVGYFLVRDIDSVFSLRERLAVEQWLESDAWFHTIHDWWTHTDLILAGLWGGVANVLPNVWQMVAEYSPTSQTTPNIDQWFLRDCLWSYVKQSCLMHDRLFRQQTTSPIPGPDPIKNQHIGCCEFSQMPEHQRQLVMPWLE